ncbi:MAG: hypothetical protein Q8R83_06405 [Legionellaceae bacterium]|nr:hypothetical protein [Legionellaceae bacterium]
MYNFNMLKQAREALPQNSMPFLDNYREQVQDEKPYQGLTILHNVPLTWMTVFKIEALALGGAHVTSTSPKSLPFEKRAADLLTQANFKVEDVLSCNGLFDLHLDCCAELMYLPSPQLGAVELTQSGSKLYQATAINYPVVSVDDTKLKVLETFLGTADGFFRALSGHMGTEINNQSFVIFGQGKVGRGIVHAIKQITDHITVVEIEENLTVRYPGVCYIDAANRSQIQDAIANAHCTVTATGVKHLLSEFYGFKKTDFGKSILINMGAEDEFGANFALNEVLFNKMAFNFSLTEPTAFRYLDPILYSHNLAIDLILSKQANKGYNAFPNEIAEEILEKWRSIYHENMDEALRA